MVPDQKLIAATAAVQEYLAKHDLPIEGVTVLGGKPYVNYVGLMAKAKKVGIRGIAVDMVKTATHEDMSAIAKSKVTMMDGSEFEDFGYGSKDSIKMSTLHNPDYINMTTITRSKCRALRSATGFAMVSAEEMFDASQRFEDAPQLAAKEGETPASKEVIIALREALKLIGKDEAAMLAHYSKTWSRVIGRLEDLTAFEAQSILVTLRPFVVKANEALKLEAPKV